MKNTFLLVLCCATALALESGCATTQKSDLASLQGKWKGHAIQDGPEHPCSFVISGTNFEFRDADTNIWYKGTFALREDTTPRQFLAVIGDCPYPQYVGKTSLAIYRIEGDTFTITGNEPGKPVVPPTFDAPDAAHLELKRE